MSTGRNRGRGTGEKLRKGKRLIETEHSGWY